MAKRKSPSAASLTKENARLALENSSLAKRSSLLETTINNSMGSLISGLSGAGGPQSNLTSLNPLLQNNTYAPLTLLWAALTYAYKSSGLVQAAIDMPVMDALRGGLELHSDQLDHDDLSKIQDYIEENAVVDRLRDAFVWARLYGGGALIINTEGDSDQPIGDEISDGGQIEFYDANRWELQCDRRIPASGKYGFYGKTLDASRVITIVGKRAPYLIRAQLSDWGMSELERIIEEHNLYLRTKNVLYEILEEAKLDVYQLEGFTAQLATSNGTALTQKRIQMTNQLKNFNNALILDAKDKFEQKTLTFSGLADIMRENRMMIASVLRIPVAKLFGVGATGFSSGQDDIENYNGMVEAECRGPMRMVVRKVLQIIVKNLFGDELDIDFKFKPLRILSAVEEEGIKSSMSTRFMALYDKRLMDSKEFGEILQKEQLVPIALKAEQGLLDEHPEVENPNQPDLPTQDTEEGTPIEEPKGEGVPKDEKPKKEKKSEKVEKAAPAEKAEKAEPAPESKTFMTEKKRNLK